MERIYNYGFASFLFMKGIEVKKEHRDLLVKLTKEEILAFSEEYKNSPFKNFIQNIIKLTRGEDLCLYQI